MPVLHREELARFEGRNAEWEGRGNKIDVKHGWTSVFDLAQDLSLSSPPRKMIVLSLKKRVSERHDTRMNVLQQKRVVRDNRTYVRSWEEEKGGGGNKVIHVRRTDPSLRLPPFLQTET